MTEQESNEEAPSDHEEGGVPSNADDLVAWESCLREAAGRVNETGGIRKGEGRAALDVKLALLNAQIATKSARSADRHATALIIVTLLLVLATGVLAWVTYRYTGVHGG